MYTRLKAAWNVLLGRPTVFGVTFAPGAGIHLDENQSNVVIANNQVVG